jgi:hypothetical protein
MGNGQQAIMNREDNRNGLLLPGCIRDQGLYRHEESWNVTELPLDKQKPLDITKNKPEERRRRSLKRSDSNNRINAAVRHSPEVPVVEVE